MSNKMAVTKWFDSDTTETIYIAAKEYGLDILAKKPTEDDNEIEVCVYGPTENVDRFIEDVAEGDVDPFDNTRDLTEDEYQSWLAKELSAFGFLYIPTYANDSNDLED
jgi:acylphosphatase